MLSITRRPEHDSLGEPRPDFLDSSPTEYLLPQDERRLHRVMTLEPGLNSSGPLYEGSCMQSDFPGTVNICSHSTLDSTIGFLREIRAKPELRLLEMSGDHHTGLKVTIRHLRPSELYVALATMNTVRQVMSRDGELTVELGSIGSQTT